MESTKNTSCSAPEQQAALERLLSLATKVVYYKSTCSINTEPLLVVVAK